MLLCQEVNSGLAPCRHGFHSAPNFTRSSIALRSEMGLESTQTIFSITPSQDPGHYDLNWIFKQFPQGPVSNGFWCSGKIPPLASIPWLILPGCSSEKPHNLFKGHPPEKISSRPWFEIVGWARSYLRNSKCVKLFPKYLGSNIAAEASHWNPSPLTLKYVCTAEKFFWFWCPYTNCQHTVSFFTALWCTWRSFLPWTRSHNSKCV